MKNPSFVQRVIVRNFWLKILSLAIAVFLWALVANATK